MGAAGFITIYDEEKVREAYTELWGDLGYKLEEDWTYPNWDPDEDSEWTKYVVRHQIGGRWYLFDYWDDQGGHDGMANSFWFSSWNLSEEEKARQWAEIDERVPEDEQHFELGSPERRDKMFGPVPAQGRVLCAIRKAQPEGQVGEVEVWT